MLNFKSRIQPIHLVYKNPLTPVSPLFDDVYFDASEGVAESTYLYLDGNQINEKIGSGVSKITIGEIGFGVGLNFILTFKRFLEEAKPGQHLTYISVEKHPVFKEDLSELYSRFPDLKPYADELLKHYPLLTPGFHWIRFPHHPVSLLLLLGDATDELSQLEAKVDLWYWDGFSPAKNPDAFSILLFQEIARLSAPDARGSSFTSAGWVRRGLQEVGFEVDKRVGFGRKRECIQANFEPANAAPEKMAPWFSSQKLVHAIPGKDKIGIIGAGLAGTAIAQSLFKRGFEVHIIDQLGVAERASSNDVGLYNTQLSKLPNPISRFSQLSLAHFLRELEQNPVPKRKGILRIDEDALTCMSTSEYPESFYQKLTAEEATEKAEVRIDREAMFFPECGIINPRTLCMKRIQGSHINLHRLVHKVIRNDETHEHAFTLVDSEGETLLEVDHLVYASGADTPFTLEELTEFPMKPVRGQTIQVKPTEESRTLQVTLVDQGYITPIVSQITDNPHHLIGATYQAKTILPDQVEKDTYTLLHEARSKWPAFHALHAQDAVSAKEGYRLSTPDKLPLIGPRCEFGWMKTHYEKFLRGASPKAGDAVEPLQVSPKEWMLLGLGSRGITFSSYGAEILANLMCGDVLPVERDLWEHLHPARFFVRKLKKPVVE